MSAVRVLLVDDQALFREALRILLSVQPGIEVVGEVGNGADAFSLIPTTRPDVILMDLQMPILDGVEATRRIREEFLHMQMIVLTTFDDDEYVFEGLRAGAVGYLLKDASSGKLVEAIEAASNGESFLQPSIAAKVIAELNRAAAPRPESLPEPLTAREVDILRLLTSGKNNREIADELVITEGTVKNHITNIFGKLGVRDRTQAAIKARDMRLI